MLNPQYHKAHRLDKAIENSNDGFKDGNNDKIWNKRESYWDLLLVKRSI